MKRTGDLFFAVFFLLLLSPLFILIGIAIKWTSKGPVFYRGIRTGLNGVPFRIFKFRTMVVNEVPEGTTALHDARVTKIGRRLRALKIDELPQLLNIIRGEMSFVGPRPELPRYTHQYRGEEKKILSVRPGLTDYSSIVFSSLDTWVGAENADEIFEEKILAKKNKLRLKYVADRTLWLDMKLIALTIKVIFQKALKIPTEITFDV